MDWIPGDLHVAAVDSFGYINGALLGNKRWKISQTHHVINLAIWVDLIDR